MLFNDKTVWPVSLGLCGAVMLVGLAACAGAPTPLPDDPDTALYRDRCGGCHSLPHPARHTREQWPGVVALMDQRMTEKGMHPLSGEERARILGYLERHGR